MNIIYFEVLISTFYPQNLFTMLFYLTYLIHVNAWFLQSNKFFYWNLLPPLWLHCHHPNKHLIFWCTLCDIGKLKQMTMRGKTWLKCPKCGHLCELSDFGSFKKNCPSSFGTSVCCSFALAKINHGTNGRGHVVSIRWKVRCEYMWIVLLMKM
jgi:hypothetical protein